MWGMISKRHRNQLIVHWKGLEMRDLAADWEKWSFAERLLAMVLVLILIGLPLRVLMTSTPL
jgi:hypothetical protein